MLVYIWFVPSFFPLRFNVSLSSRRVCVAAIFLLSNPFGIDLMISTIAMHKYTQINEDHYSFDSEYSFGLKRFRRDMCAFAHSVHGKVSRHHNLEMQELCNYFELEYG